MNYQLKLKFFFLILISVPVMAAEIFHGSFKGQNWLHDFNSIQQSPWTEGIERTAVVEDPQKHKSVLQVRYPAKAYGNERCGAQWMTYLGKSFEKLTVSYEIKFGDGFEFVLGGKLPGLVGGHADAHPHMPITGGLKPTGKNGWSARIMWRKNGEIVQYVYHPDQKGKWGDDFPWTSTGKPVTFTPGKWQTVKTEITMNTPGKKDGVIRSWLDGNLALKKTDLRFRDTREIGIDALCFSTFYGGEEPEWAPQKETKAYFDNFIISN